MKLDRTALDDLRARAERCLASAEPTAAEAHELAAVALEVLSRVEPLASSDAPVGSGAHPYRAPDASAPSAAPTATATEGETSRVASLERALEDCQLRLHEARSEIARHGG